MNLRIENTFHLKHHRFEQENEEVKRNMYVLTDSNIHQTKNNIRRLHNKDDEKGYLLKILLRYCSN